MKETQVAMAFKRNFLSSHINECEGRHSKAGLAPAQPSEAQLSSVLLLYQVHDVASTSEIAQNTSV